MRNTVVLVLISILIWGCQGQPQQDLTNKVEKMSYRVESPTKHTVLTVNVDEHGQARYQYAFNNKNVIAPSTLGFKLQNMAPLHDNFVVIDSQLTNHKETWEQPWGEQRFIDNHYTQLLLTLQQQDEQQRQLQLEFRVFDDGVGFRYHFPEQPHLSAFEILEELTEFNPVESLSAWWTPAQAGNQYEYLYQHTQTEDIDLVHTPLTLLSDNDYVISIHEAALHDYSTMNIQQQQGKLKASLVPWSPQTEVKVKATAPFSTPWRTVSVAENETQLLTSYITLNLNEPSKVADTSWIKPGKFVGIWWELHLELGSWKQGETHGATTANTKKYIDFAAKHNIDGVLVEGWNEGWDGEWFNHGGGAFNFTKAYPDYDLAEVNRYAQEKGVYIVGHHETGSAIDNYDAQLEDAYSLLQQQGMKAVKSGYVETGEILTSGQYHHGQYFVRHVDRVTQMAADKQVMLVAHETVKDTGERRTYPNLMSREVARGQEYDAWATDGGNPPNHTTILPFTRMLSGPMDFTPGVFELDLPTRPNNQVNTTLAKQLALYVVLYSPMQMVSDLPENYEKHLDAFQFIKDVAVDWHTTHIVDGKIGEFIVTARQQRNSDNWFVGAITNEKARTVSIDFSFLENGQTYRAHIYRDADDAHYQSNPAAYKIEQREIKATDILEFNLAAGGGLAISLLR